MTLKSIGKSAVGPAVGVVFVALAIRYFGNNAFLKEVKLGLQGDVSGAWFS